MDKIIEYYYGENDSELVSLIHPKSFEKTAQMSDELSTFISNLEHKEGVTYALVNALSSSEFWGQNLNGDIFPEEALKKYHHTFVEHGHVFSHHINSDPKLSMGNIIFSHYHPTMHRVELILELDNKKAKDVVENLQKGILKKISMGTKVPWDECNCCHNRAKSRQEYCIHLKTQMGQILPGGKRVGAINWQPKFFDLSIVTIPADKTASFLKMLTADKKNNNLLKQKLASFEENNYIKLAELKTIAEIKKTVTGTVAAIDTDPKKLLIKKLKNETIEKLSAYPFNSVLSTFLGLRIFPTKEDFQKLALKKELPDNGIFEINEHTEPIIPSDVSYDYFDPKIASILESEVPQLSLTKELVVTRALNELTGKKEEWNQSQPPSERSFLSRLFFGKEEEPKTSPQKNPIVPLGILGGLYYGYAKIFNDASSTGFRNFMVKNPWLIPLLIGGATIGTLELQDKLFTKQAASVDRFFRNSLISFPIAYYVSGKAEHEAQQGKHITSTQNFIRKHPALVALITAGLGASAESKLDKLLKIGSVVSRLPEEILNSMYSDLTNSKEE